MNDAVLADRVQFAFTILFHYLFPVLTMGLGVLIALLKTLYLVKGDPLYNMAARFWARIFAVNFAMGVVTGIPMEFQFGTNFARFSDYAGQVMGLTLFMEGVFAFFLESTFLGLFLFGEGRVSPKLHWFSSVMVAFGATLSGYFIVASDAWMQHPVGYRIVNGHVELTSLSARLWNPYVTWQFLHTMSGAYQVGCMVMAGIGAYYLLARKHEAFGRLCVRVGVLTGVFFSLTSLFPTGAKSGENVTKFQPVKMAAMEGLFETQNGAPLAILGMPDVQNRRLIDPIAVPGILSYLAYGNANARVVGLNDFDRNLWPPVEVVYYAYHIMVGLGTIFIGIMGLAALLLWRKKLYTTRWYLWVLMFAMPFPYIANEAGWTVACVGRQPWIIYGLMKTKDAISTNVSGGETVFTLLGFAGLYALLGLLFLFLMVRILAEGPETGSHGATPVPDVPAGVGG